MSASGAKRSRLSVRYFDDRILLTETHAWAYFRVPTISYEFMTGQQREALATNLTVALAGHQDGRRRGAPADRAPQLPGSGVGDRPARDLRRRPGLGALSRRDVPAGLGQGLLDQGGLPRRPAWPARRPRSADRRRVRSVRPRLQGERAAARARGRGRGPRRDRQVDRARRPDRPDAGGEFAGGQARHRRRGRLAVPARASPAAWATRRRRPPAGAGGASARSSRWWKARFTTGAPYCKWFIRTGSPTPPSCRSRRFPDVMYFPDGEPWLHYADSLPFPVEASLRMKLIPPAKASKDVGRRLAHARDMDAHIREAGADMPLALAEQIEAARLLEHGITKERLPFVYGWHRLAVTAPDQGTVRAPGRGGDRALPRHRHRRGELHRRPVLAAERVAARGQGPARLLPAAPAAVHDRGRDADGHRRPGRPRRRRRGLDRAVHRRDDRPGPLGGALRSAGRGGAEPADRGRDHR